MFSKETREAVMRGQCGYCANCLKRVTDFHHRVHNTTANRKLFPTFMDSIFNCVGLCRDCHIHYSDKFGIGLDMAREFEEALR